MGKAGMDKIGFGQGYYLGLVLQAPKGRRKYHPVVIHFKTQAGFVLFLS
jgi:hypothetical protein